MPPKRKAAAKAAKAPAAKATKATKAPAAKAKKAPTAKAKKATNTPTIDEADYVRTTSDGNKRGRVYLVGGKTAKNKFRRYLVDRDTLSTTDGVIDGEYDGDFLEFPSENEAVAAFMKYVADALADGYTVAVEADWPPSDDENDEPVERPPWYESDSDASELNEDAKFERDHNRKVAWYQEKYGENWYEEIEKCEY